MEHLHICIILIMKIYLKKLLSIYAYLDTVKIKILKKKILYNDIEKNIKINDGIITFS